MRIHMEFKNELETTLLQTFSTQNDLAQLVDEADKAQHITTDSLQLKGTITWIEEIRERKGSDKKMFINGAPYVIL